MKSTPIYRNIREYENLHIALWLVKDACWVMDWKAAGMVMIIPTLFVALHLTWKSRNHKTDLFHNIAICLWIGANGTWMTGEFFYNDTLRPVAMLFFGAGIMVVTAYYVQHFSRRKHSIREETITEESEEPSITSFAPQTEQAA